MRPGNRVLSVKTMIAYPIRPRPSQDKASRIKRFSIAGTRPSASKAPANNSQIRVGAMKKVKAGACRTPQTLSANDRIASGTSSRNMRSRA